jgi:hypothetical protein
VAQAVANNGFSNLQCYWLGLSPLDVRATFKVQAGVQPATGYPRITWNAVGGKTYAVEYANRLGGGANLFIQALTITATNVAAGVLTTNSFVDDYTLTGGLPANGRFYRIRLVYP